MLLAGQQRAAGRYPFGFRTICFAVGRAPKSLA
jgi:hypothetical protein